MHKGLKEEITAGALDWEGSTKAIYGGKGKGDWVVVNHRRSLTLLFETSESQHWLGEKKNDTRGR